MIPKMLCGLFVLLLVGVGCGWAQVTVPDTPAGHTLQAWLTAFNSGDRAKNKTYVKTGTSHSPSMEWSHSTTQLADSTCCRSKKEQ